MSSLVEDIVSAGNWIAEALTVSGYRADFTPSSLWEIDRFIEENSKGGMPVGLLADDTGGRLFALGGYLGEVIRRERGGEWHADDADPAGEIDIEFHLPDNSIVWPVRRAIARLSNGAQDNIGAYGRTLGLPVGVQPVKPKRRWWPFSR